MRKSILFITANLVALTPVMAVNIIQNGSFEEDVQVTGSNNNVFVPITGWSFSAGAANLVNPAPNITQGPNVAQDGAQYLDITITGGIFQTFSITETSSVDFSGYFSRRNPGDVTSTLGIFSADGSTLISSVDVTNFTAEDINTWTLGSGSIASLAAGTYRIGAELGDNANVDNISLNVVAVPEPSSSALLALGGVALLARRRR